MRLVVTGEELNDVPINIYALTSEQLSDMSYHPFIATTNWSEVFVQVTAKTPKNILKQIIEKCPIKLFILEDEELTYSHIQIIAEINRSKALLLRNTFYNNKDGLDTLLREYVTFVKSVEELL